MINDNPDKSVLRPNFYGRRSGRSLRDIQRVHLQQDLAALSPGPVSPAENPDRTPLDLGPRFADQPVWLEIGFGGGEHLIHQAQSQPDIRFIGCEPFINGVATLLGKLRKTGLSNVSVYPDDVRDLFEVLPETAISRAFLLYPDPWPKTRHHRRRFVTPGYLKALARVMRRGAEFRVASDIPDYVRQALEQVPVHGFRLCSQAKGVGQGWPDWVTTRYEQKALRAGRSPHYLTFERV